MDHISNVPIEPDRLFPRVRIDREGALLFAMGFVGLLLAPAIALPLERAELTTIGVEIAHLWEDRLPLELFLPIPSLVFTLLAGHLLLFADHPRISVVTAGLLVVFSALTLGHQIYIWQFTSHAGLRSWVVNFSAVHYNTAVLSAAAGAAIRNLRRPSLETAFLANGAMVAWLFIVAFPGAAQFYPA